MSEVTTFDEIAKTRETRKVFADPAAPPAVPDGFVDAVWDATAVAGWAPFHYPAHASHRETLTSPVPWRFHVLDHLACRQLIADLGPLSEAHPNVGPLASVNNGKIPNMLAAAGALVLVTWLPHPTKREEPNDKLALMNQEHLLASAAATQTLLLALTARGLRTYWSSGGALATEPVFDHLGIGPNEKFTAALFVWPGELENEQSVPGKHRDTRGDVTDYARRVGS